MLLIIFILSFNYLIIKLKFINLNDKFYKMLILYHVYLYFFFVIFLVYLIYILELKTFKIFIIIFIVILFFIYVCLFISDIFLDFNYMSLNKIELVLYV